MPDYPLSPLEAEARLELLRRELAEAERNLEEMKGHFAELVEAVVEARAELKTGTGNFVYRALQILGGE